MPAPDLLLAFMAATLVFAYMPGPALLYTAAQTIARGRRAGWQAVLGLHVGGYAHVLAAAMGLAVLFELVPLLFTLVKLAGAAYLIWLGARLILRPSDTSGPNPQPTRTAFWQSVTVEMLNPKTALFFLAFLPQFCDPAAALPIWAQLMVLGTVVNLTFSSADVLCVLFASRIARGLRGAPGRARLAQRLGGGVLVGLGVKLALTRN